MSILVPLPKSGFTAIYYPKLLKIYASGDIPGWYREPHLKRDVIFGGVKVSLVAVPFGGGPPKPASSLQAVIEVNIDLDQPHTHITSVTCESLEGSFDIPINTYSKPQEYPPPGSNLIPLENRRFDATYSASTNTLTAFADGDVGSMVLGPQLYRDPQWDGGVKFQLLGYYGGIKVPGQPPQYRLEASDAIEFDDFKWKVITIQTENGSFEVPVRRIGDDKDSNDAATGQNEPTPGTVLVPLPESGFKAGYDTKSHTLTVFADGEIPGWIISPHLEQDTLLGGFKFSLRGFPGGLPVPLEVPLKTSIQLEVILPSEHFESRTVTCQSATGTYNIEIHYTGVDGQSKTS